MRFDDTTKTDYRKITEWKYCVMEENEKRDLPVHLVRDGLLRAQSQSNSPV